MFKTATALAAFVIAGTPAFADEVWSSEIGDIIYESDLYNGQAVLSYPLPDDGEEGVRGLAFVDDLALNYDNRSVHGGIWIEPETGDQGCATAVLDPTTNQPSTNWGRIELIFLTNAFPSGFVVKRGSCFEEPSNVLVAKPIVGGE
ncbi:MAG: hypothetical protein AAF829_01825 [Pseudomonadota bacterium]